MTTFPHPVLFLRPIVCSFSGLRMHDSLQQIDFKLSWGVSSGLCQPLKVTLVAGQKSWRSTQSKSDYSSLAPSSPFEGSTFKIPNSRFMFGAFCRFEVRKRCPSSQPEKHDDDKTDVLGNFPPWSSQGADPPDHDDWAARSCCRPDYRIHTSLYSWTEFFNTCLVMCWAWNCVFSDYQLTQDDGGLVRFSRIWR